MEILQHGKCFEGNRMRCECGCLFKFDKKDIQHTQESDGIDTFVICPECKQRNYIIIYLD